ncbi:hypothetical protein ACHAWT_006265 [Skeletonema menzelii]
MRSIYTAILLLHCLTVDAFAPWLHRCPVQCQKNTIVAATELDDEDSKVYNDFDQKNQLSEPSLLVRERIKSGNYLDVLQVSVVIFFLLTLWISGGNILSDYSSNVSNGPEKTRIYKYVDADKLLRDEFVREESTVIFE